jgi:hypothetical protein
VRAVLGVFRIQLHTDDRMAWSFAHQHKMVDERPTQTRRELRDFMCGLFELLPRSFQLRLNVIVGAVVSGKHGA